MDYTWANYRKGACRPGAEVTGLEALMDRYAAQLYRLARKITQNGADAEEVVQDVFFAVYRRIDTFEGRSTLGTWLHRICINAALNSRRRKRFGLQTSLEDPAEFHRITRRADRASLEWSPDYALLMEEARTILKMEVAALPDRYRAVVLLRDVEGRPSADVAEILGESEACVKSRLHRARLVLRKQLASYFPDAGVGEPHSGRRRWASPPRCPVCPDGHRACVCMRPAPARVLGVPSLRCGARS